MPEILFDNDSHLGDNRYIVWCGVLPSGDVLVVVMLCPAINWS
jgi:hypothetical protein